MKLEHRPAVGVFVAYGTLIAGIILRVNAHAMTWPQSYSYMGSKENTIWGMQEQIVIDISYVLMALGVLFLAVIFHHWLSQSRKETSL